MINLSGPVGVTSVSVGGFEYAVSNGLVSVKPEHVAALADMGFSVAPDPADDPNSEPSDDIGTMSRNELFAFIKAKGVAVALPITNEQLRVVARDASAPAATIAPAAEPAPAAPVVPPAPEPAPAPVAPAAPVSAATQAAPAAAAPAAPAT